MDAFTTAAHRERYCPVRFFVDASLSTFHRDHFCPGGLFVDTTITASNRNQLGSPSTRFQLTTSLQANVVHGDLFEQILSLPSPVQLEPAPSDALPESDSTGSSVQETPASSDASSQSQQDEESSSEETQNATVDFALGNLPRAEALADPEPEVVENTSVPAALVSEDESADASGEQASDGEASLASELAQEEVQQAATQPALSDDSRSSVADTDLPTEDAELPEVHIEADDGEHPEYEHRRNGESSELQPAIGGDQAPTEESAEGARDATTQPHQDDSEASQEGQQPGGATDPQASDTDRNERHRRAKWYETQPDAVAQDGHKAAPQEPRSPSVSSDSLTGVSENGSDQGTSPTPPPSPENREPAIDSALQTSTTIHNIVDDLPGANASSKLAAETAKGSAEPTAAPAPAKGDKTTSRPSGEPKTKETGQGDALTQQERVRLVQRIARSFNRLGPGGGQINLKLHPPQLGSLNVQVRLEGRDLAAKLTTETVAAREAILESLPVLRSRLAEQGFDVSQFQVDVAENQGDSAFPGNQGQETFRHQNPDHARPRVDYRQNSVTDRNQSEAEQNSLTEPMSWHTAAGIDIHA